MKYDTTKDRAASSSRSYFGAKLQSLFEFNDCFKDEVSRLSNQETTLEGHKVDARWSRQTLYLCEYKLENFHIYNASTFVFL